jgi:hypothetical protein
MSIVVAGFVKNGVVVPNLPLPEGAFVEVHVIHGPIDLPPELQAELDAWQLAGAGTLQMVERLAEEADANEKGEVWRVKFPSVPVHAQAGIRPAVIVQDNKATASLPTGR